EFEQGVFAGCQMDRLAAPANVAAGRVDFQVVNTQNGVFDLVAAADEGAQASQQFFQLERLGQVVVGAEIQAANLVFDAAPGRQDQHVRLHAVAPPALEQ